MIKFSANLTMLYSDVPFVDRFERAASSGFRFIEYQFPYEHDARVLANTASRNGLTSILFNLPAGEWSKGDRGIAASPDRVEEFRQGVATGIEYARILQVRQLNCLVGRRDERFPSQDQERIVIENLRYAAHLLGERGITLLIEMLNPYDVPGFLLPTPKAAFDLLGQVGSSNLKVQYDFYHAQRVEGELANTFRNHSASIGHVQIADSPGRHQPGTGEINYRFLLEFIDRTGYQGYVGLEYVPQGTTEESLGWVQEYGYTVG